MEKVKTCRKVIKGKGRVYCGSVLDVENRKINSGILQCCLECFETHKKIEATKRKNRIDHLKITIKKVNLKCKKKGCKSLDAKYIFISTPLCEKHYKKELKKKNEYEKDILKKEKAERLANWIKGIPTTCNTYKCKGSGGNRVAIKRKGNHLFCKACFKVHLKKTKKYYKRVNKITLSNKTITCSVNSCLNQATTTHQHLPVCLECKTKYINKTIATHESKMKTDLAYRESYMVKQARRSDARDILKNRDIEKSLEIAKIFSPNLYYNVGNIREELLREVIFNRIKEITGINWINEKTLTKSTSHKRDIDIYIPELNLFIETKNTHRTQSPKAFQVKMEEHFKWIEDSIYRGASLISVSINGSMCDYNILQFLYLVHIYLKRKQKIKNCKKIAKSINELRSLIRSLQAKKHLFEENVWPELTTDKIIAKLAKKNSFSPSYKAV